MWNSVSYLDNLLLSINHNMDVQSQRCTYGNGATMFEFVYERTDAWTVM